MELKPCPFCGRDARVHLVDITGCYDRTIRYSYQPGCETDGCPGEYGECSYGTNDAAVAAWNTRPTDPLLKEMADALEELDDMFDPSSRVGEIINKPLQKYHDHKEE